MYGITRATDGGVGVDRGGASDSGSVVTAGEVVAGISLLRRGVHKSVAALEKDIKNWIKHWNAGPKPFVWKKTAEEIPVDGAGGG